MLKTKESGREEKKEKRSDHHNTNLTNPLFLYLDLHNLYEQQTTNHKKNTMWCSSGG